MFLVLLMWLQSQPLSKTIIVIASLLFVLAIALLVYFLRKLKTSSKTEEDWSLTRSSLFVGPAAEASVADATQAAETLVAPEPVEPTPGETRLLASDALDAEARATDNSPTIPLEPLPAPEMAAPPKTSEAPPATELLATAPPAPPTRDERRTQLFSSSPTPREERATEVLSSLPPEPLSAPEAIVADTPATDAATPFDEEIWAGLDEAQPLATSEATQELHSHVAPPIAPQADEPPPTARVEQRPPRAPFEPPVVEPIRRQRETFEPPAIQPITPREQTALLGTQPDAAPAKRDLYSPDELPRSSGDQPTAGESNLYHQTAKPEPTAPLYSDSTLRRDRASDIDTPRPPEASGPAADQVWDTASVAPSSRARSAHKPAGAVLGLPMEMNHAPLVLGTPARSREEMGIGSLTDYGKVDKEGGRGGMVALLVALLLFGGAAAAYFFVPSVHERVNAWIARTRGIDPNEQTSTQPKAMIFPSRVPETDKNTVHAKGAVQNITNETLENLSLEVQLNKSGGETETFNIQVTPAQIAPNDQGTYAFDYDGKGITSYTIKHLLSNNKEVYFTAPGQK
ncbi:MAG: hypothetical protein V7641_2696 [Blastocatellia bacterium]